MKVKILLLKSLRLIGKGQNELIFPCYYLIILKRVVNIIIIYMIIGFLFGTLLVSLLATLSDVISTYGELVKSRLLVKISENNVLIHKNNEALEETVKEAIGFRIPTDEDEIII